MTTAYVKFSTATRYELLGVLAVKLAYERSIPNGKSRTRTTDT
jgi:hypothetical protein